MDGGSKYIEAPVVTKWTLHISGDDAIIRREGDDCFAQRISDHLCFVAL